MAAPVLYATLTELKDRLGITDNDRDMALEQVLDAASRWVERETGNRRFYSTTQTRYYTVATRGWLPPSDISERPGGGNQFYNVWGGTTYQYVTIDDVTAVTQVATDEDGDGVYERLWTLGTDYYLYPRNAPAEGKPYRAIYRNPVTGRYFLPLLEGSVSVTGDFGYSTTTPSEIRNLVLTACELLGRQVMDTYMPGVSTYKLSTELSVTFASNDLPASAQRTLDGFREFMGVL